MALFYLPAPSLLYLALFLAPFTYGVTWKIFEIFFLILSLISSLTITINFSHAFVFFFSEISEKARLDLFCILISSLTP